MSPTFPFCLAWANESWSRSWLGDAHDRNILVEQRYSEEDDRAHSRWLASAFADSRYIRIHGRPLLVIYKPKGLPDPRRTTDTIRDECTRLGLPEPYLVGIDAHCSGTDLRDFGFDMTEHHEPQLGVLAPDVFTDAALRSKFKRNLKRGILSSTFKVYSYAEATALMAQVRPTFPHFPCCFVGWDNTRPSRPQRDRHGRLEPRAVPRPALADEHERPAQASPGASVFINAWNEWAEGMYLEPDQTSGHAYLQAVTSVLEEIRNTEVALKLSA